MWIGLALVVTLNGQLITDASAFKTASECREEIAGVVKRAEASGVVFAYSTQCFEAEKVLTVKKVRSAPPVAPLPPPRVEKT